MVFVDGLSGAMFEADPDDIHEKLANVNGQLTKEIKDTSFEDFWKMVKQEHGRIKSNSRRIRMLNQRY